MIISSPKSLRELRDLPFCYLCGRRFEAGSILNRDHIPPKSMFKQSDRLSPLIMPTHETCNNDRAGEDELVSQLVAVLHGKRPGSDKLKRNLSIFTPKTGKPVIGMGGVALSSIIWRWVQGFHAALYREYTAFPGGYIFSPMPEGHIKDGKLVFLNDHKDRSIWVQVLKANRMVERTDEVRCWGEKCRYECTWTTLDDGKNICVFGLQIYNWEALGDTQFEPRGCVGYYGPTKCAPPLAAIGTKLQMPISNVEPLQPFGR
jgi:hypothetical protein